VTPPSDGLGSVSERDAVMREREAFQRGCRYAAGAILRSTHVDQERAARIYPLPADPGSSPDGQEVDHG
jgi:hypothetical protein